MSRYGGARSGLGAVERAVESFVIGQVGVDTQESCTKCKGLGFVVPDRPVSFGLLRQRVTTLQLFKHNGINAVFAICGSAYCN